MRRDIPKAQVPPHSADLRKGRVSLPNQTYLITTVTQGRAPLFADWRVGRILVQSLRHAHDTGRVSSLAFVVMPDHLHWLFVLGERARLSDVVGAMKSFSAARINAHLNRRGVRVWQDGFHDHALRREEDLRELARYIIANPLRAGLVERVGDYPLWDAVWI
jgi:putative transposase